MGKKVIKRARKARQRVNQNIRARSGAVQNRAVIRPLSSWAAGGLRLPDDFAPEALLTPSAKLDADMIEAMALMNTAREEGSEIGAETWKRYDEAVARARRKDQAAIVAKRTQTDAQIKASISAMAKSVGGLAPAFASASKSMGTFAQRADSFAELLKVGIVSPNEMRTIMEMHPVEAPSSATANIHFIVTSGIRVARHVCETDWNLRRANFGGRGPDPSTWITPCGDLIKFAHDEHVFHGARTRDAIVIVGPNAQEDRYTRRILDYARAMGLTLVAYTSPDIPDILSTGTYIPF